jgi:hypothetical protein
MNFILTYSDKVNNNDMEISIYLVLYCFYFQYQFEDIPYKNITLEKYVNSKCKKLPKLKYILNSLGNVISNIYFWVLIGLFFFLSCYYEINFIFAVKLGLFLYLTFNTLLKFQNSQNEFRIIDDKINSNKNFIDEIENQPIEDEIAPKINEILIKEKENQISTNEILLKENDDNLINLKKEEEEEEDDNELLINEKENENNSNNIINEENDDTIFLDKNKNLLIKNQNKNDSSDGEFSYCLHYIFLIFCSLN